MRIATPSDIPEVVRITNLAYVVEAFCIRGERINEDKVRTRMATGCFLVIPEENETGRLRASVFLQPEEGRLYLGLLSVAPEFQGAGLARRLVEAAVDEGRARRSKFLDLTVVSARRELFAFYEKLGFHANDVLPFEGDGDPIIPLHFVRMTRALYPAGEL